MTLEIHARAGDRYSYVAWLNRLIGSLHAILDNWICHYQRYFANSMVVSSIGWANQNTHRIPPTFRKYFLKLGQTSMQLGEFLFPNILCNVITDKLSNIVVSSGPH